MERVYRQVAEVRRVVGGDGDWKSAVDAFAKLADAFEALAGAEEANEAVRQLQQLAPELNLQLMSKRSATVKATCADLERIVVVTEVFFSDAANLLAPTIACLAKSSSTAFRVPSGNLLGRITELTRFDLQLLRTVFLKEKAHERVCVLLLEQLPIVFVYWSPDEVAPYFSDIVALIDGGLHAGSEAVRKAARDAVASLSSYWPNRLDELRDMPPQQRVELVREHPDSGIARALLTKYPDLPDKVEKANARAATRQNSRRYSRIPVKRAASILDDTHKADEVVSRTSSNSATSVVSVDDQSELQEENAAAETSKQKINDRGAPAATDAPTAKDESIRADPVKRASSMLDDEQKAGEILSRSSFNLPSSAVYIEDQSELLEEPAVVETAEQENSECDTSVTNDESRGIIKDEDTRVVSTVSDTFAQHVPPEFDGTQMYGHTLPRPSFIPSPPTEPIVESEAIIRKEPFRRSFRTSSESRIPQLSHSRSSSITSTPTIQTESATPAGAIPPIELSGVSAPHSAETIAHQADLLEESTSVLSHEDGEAAKGFYDLVAAEAPATEGVWKVRDDSNYPSIIDSEQISASATLPITSTDWVITEEVDPTHDTSSASLVSPPLAEISAAIGDDDLRHDALEKLNEIRQRYADLRSISKAGNQEVVLENLKTQLVFETTLVQDSPDSLLQEDSNPEPMRHNELKEARQPKTIKSADRRALPTDTHKRGRSRDLERKRSGDNFGSGFTEQGIVRKHSVPDLLKGVRLKYEDKPSAPVHVVVPPSSDEQQDSAACRDMANTFAPIELSAGSSEPELNGHVAQNDENHVVSLLSAAESDHLVCQLSAAEPEPATSGPVAPEQIQCASRQLDRDDEPLIGIRRASPILSSVAPKSPRKRKYSLPSLIVCFWVVLALAFGASGLIRAASTIRETYEYHNALQQRIDRFEISISESRETVRKLEENYVVWSEYVRVLAEEDEANAVAHLEMIHHEVEKWQRDMKADLLEFRKSLSAESLEAVLAPLRRNASTIARSNGEI